jgi:hypothetical protein
MFVMLPNITIDELRSCSWVSIIEQVDEKSCLYYSSLFHSESLKFEPDSPEMKSFSLLGAICSMMFSTEIGEEVFIPIFSGPNGRSALPQDLTDSHIEVLFQFLDDVNDPELKSRLADVIWVKRKAHRFESAKIAISEYIKSCEILKNINELDAIERLCRAVNLSHEIGSGGSELQKYILSYAEKYAIGIQPQKANGCHYQLYQMLVIKKYGNQTNLAEKCKDIADNCKLKYNYHLMRLYLNLQHDFLRNTGANDDKLRPIQMRKAESYIYESEIGNSAIAKSHFLELAIQAFRQIGSCSERVDELHEKLINIQKKIPDEMITFRTNDIDISEIINTAMNSVSGFSFVDALIKLAFIDNLSKESELRAKAQSAIFNHPINHIVQKKFIDAKGKTTGKVGPLNFNSSLNDDIVAAEIFQHMSIKVNLCVEAKILPALHIINTEHSINLDTILDDIVSNNPFVPNGHEYFFARGLLFGFNRDFVSACLYLVPQIENSIRNIMELYGIVITSKLSSSGVQKEKDLNELLVDKDVINIFGHETIFNLRVIFTEQHGSNIRNLLAHGLLNYEELQSPHGVYCWWLILRLIMIPHLNKYASK